MNLFAHISALVTEFISLCKKAADMNIDFGLDHSLWFAQLEARSACVNCAQKANNLLKPLLAQWNAEAHTLEQREEMERILDARAEAVRLFVSENSRLCNEASIKKEAVRKELMGMQRSSHARACYAGH